MHFIKYPWATFGTVAVVVLGYLASLTASAWIRSRHYDRFESYRKRNFTNTILFLIGIIAIAALWSRLLQHKGTFLGLIGAGLAVALREPLLAIAGRIAIFAGHIYKVGDRIEISHMAGDVIAVGFFYTRLMEIGNWVRGDQATGRITQFSNSMIFGTPVFNYTQNFSYVWDEVVLPVTYDSNIGAAKDILLEAADKYTHEFLKKAENELQSMSHSFLVPKFDLKPSVFVEITDNYVNLTMRYIVDPKQRRAGKSFIYSRALEMLKERNDISFGSTTADLTLHQPDLKRTHDRHSDRQQDAA